MGLRSKTTVYGAASAQGAEGTALARMFEGNFFIATRPWLGVAPGGNLDVLLKVEHDSAHLNTRFNTQPAVITVSLSVYESPTFSDDGFSVSVVNMNRSSSRVTEVTAFHSPTVTDVGTLLASGVAGISGSVSLGGIEGFPVPEIICSPGLNYLIRATNLGAFSVSRSSTAVGWYE